ncbi:hypothetical protein A3742_02125 [Oleiphilus sp. HI0071]|nr:hypothetical protein A3737_05915 [Oleiphilus sp. HI0065]KZY79669.1 hypothetical protein A3742_02125 [Oleiphilus sp. HI0071]KZZ06166.1 hypothetical protein A3744_07800 [Oleiphilus sp. HI0073]KZZ16657.1 hypothetical protein A3751_14155 [Oleiphilus sp. HI0080]KZZ51978.1 hypothetical protein A3760_11520 [Oleiphilus sp. HI0122]KZZ78321.1 hypothetical protein A3767_13260 [Oleiphilus sp. HI0133]
MGCYLILICCFAQGLRESYLTEEIMYPSLFAFCTGVLLVHFSPSPFAALAIFVAICFFVCVYCGLFSARFRRRLQGALKQLLTVFLLALFGVSYASWEVASHQNMRVAESESGEHKFVSGYLCSIPVNHDFGVRVTLCTDRGRYLLSLSGDAPRPESGMCWQGTVKLKAPRSSFNPWSGSYERYLFAERIVGFAYAKSLERFDCSLSQHMLSLVTEQRWKLKRYLDSQLSGLDQSGVVIALVLGHRAEISAHQSEVLKLSGTQHLMAISGLHVGIVCWLVYFMLQKAGIRYFVFPAVALVGLVYIAMVGFSPSAQRAYVMMLCAMALISGKVPGGAWSAYLLALVLVLGIDPLAPLNPGFWFSFVAVFWLILIYRMLLKGRSYGLLKSMIILQCLLTLGLMPIQTHFAMHSSVFSLPANLVAIPWVSVVVLPLSLLSVLVSALLPVMASIGFDVVDTVLNFLFAFLAIGLEFGLGVGAAANSAREQLDQILYGVSYSALLLFLLIMGRLRLLWLAAGLLLLIFLLVLNTRFGGISSVSSVEQFAVLDVGQGLSLVAQQDEQLWIYDTGPSYAKYSSAKTVLLSYLREYAGLVRKTYLVVSHGDADHAGDAKWLATKLQPRVALLGEPERTEMPKEQRVRPCMLGQRLNTGALSMSVLWPAANPTLEQARGNARSCVVRFTLFGYRFLVMGDLEGEYERAFIRHYAQLGKLDELRSEVLIAGHHGAKAATRISLLKHVKPSFVIFSSGYGNRFQHPSAEAVGRAKRFGAEVLNTADTGALIFKVKQVSVGGDTRLELERSRNQSDVYWLAR